MIDEEAIKVQFCQLMEESGCDAWLSGKELVERLLVDKLQLSKPFISQIKRKFSRCKNLLIMLFIYKLGVELNEGFFSDDYIKKFKELTGGEVPACYFEITAWIERQSIEVQQEATEFIVQFLSVFFNMKLGTISQFDYEFLILIFNKMRIQSTKSSHIAMGFISNLRNLRVDSQKKEETLIRTVVQILANSEGNGNLSILFDQYLLGSQQEANVHKYCLQNDNYLSELTIQELLRIFRELFRREINLYILDLVNRVSRILEQGDQFFKLKKMYVEFVLPVLARLGKHCIKQGIEIAVLKLCEFYAVGFNQHCNIGEDGIGCLLQGIQYVSSQNYRKRWASLSFLTAKDERQKQSIEILLIRKGFEYQLINQCKFPYYQQQTWEITNRNIRELKMYKRIPSKFKGINNKQFQCYIISVVQALFHTQKLTPLLERVNKKSRGLANLVNIFKQLNSFQSFPIRVNELQKTGPLLFAYSDIQEDAQQYLLALMNFLEEELKIAKLQMDFKKIFQISSRAEINCKSCSNKTVCNQNQYIHTVHYKEQISEETNEILEDFTCEKCKKQNCTKTTKLTLDSQILIVHINRFSNIKGKIKKELPTSKILRRMGKYELVGIIFHIGKFVQSGHYIYYSKVSRRRWVELNDETTTEIQLDDQNQEFERQFRAEMTPYILFYQRNY